MKQRLMLCRWFFEKLVLQGRNDSLILLFRGDIFICMRRKGFCFSVKEVARFLGVSY